MASRKSRAPGGAIRAYLEKHGLSQQDFADQVGVSQSIVSQWINGVKSVSPEMAREVEHVTGIPRLALLYPDERAA